MIQAYVMPGLTDCRPNKRREHWAQAGNAVEDWEAIQASNATMSLTQCLIEV